MSNATRVEALFFAALEKGTAAERAAYLDSACGGAAELRYQVEKLLKAHPRVGDFLQKPVVEQLAAPAEPADATQQFDASTAGQGAGPADRLIGPPGERVGPSSMAKRGHDDHQEHPGQMIPPRRGPFRSPTTHGSRWASYGKPTPALLMPGRTCGTLPWKTTSSTRPT
jgi:hypothetical protein